jgi:hypothetical protein
MAEISLRKQITYARVLQTQWGYPVLVPTAQIKLGDVGYFVGSAYARAFNVFALNSSVAPLCILKRNSWKTADEYGVTLLNNRQPEQHQLPTQEPRNVFCQVSRDVELSLNADATAAYALFQT